MPNTQLSVSQFYSNALTVLLLNPFTMQLQMGNPEHIQLYRQFCFDIERYSKDESALRFLCKEYNRSSWFNAFQTYRTVNFRNKGKYFGAIALFAKEVCRRVFEQKHGRSIIQPITLPF